MCLSSHIKKSTPSDQHLNVKSETLELVRKNRLYNTRWGVEKIFLNGTLFAQV